MVLEWLGVSSNEMDIQMSWQITPPNNIQRNDTCGGAHFGASRSGGRTHKGEDIQVVPTFEIVSPIEGFIAREGQVYDATPTYRLIEIEGTGRHTGYLVKIMYAVPYSVQIPVIPGQIIGYAQAISDYYTCDMQDHLHVEVYKDGTLINPAPLLYQNQQTNDLSLLGLSLILLAATKISKLWLL